MDALSTLDALRNGFPPVFNIAFTFGQGSRARPFLLGSLFSPIRNLFALFSLIILYSLVLSSFRHFHQSTGVLLIL
jgi:hypothetical protein